MTLMMWTLTERI